MKDLPTSESTSSMPSGGCSMSLVYYSRSRGETKHMAQQTPKGYNLWFWWFLSWCRCLGISIVTARMACAVGTDVPILKNIWMMIDSTVHPWDKINGFANYWILIIEFFTLADWFPRVPLQNPRRNGEEYIPEHRSNHIHNLPKYARQPFLQCSW